MPYIGHSPTQAGSYIEVDDFGSSFNGSNVAFTLQVGGVNITPNQQNLLVMIDGVLQQPSNAFSVSGSTITFTEAPASGADLYCLLMGQSASVGQGTIGSDELKVSGDGTDGQVLKSDGDGTFTWLSQDDIAAGTLANARTINGVSFNGSANITVTADANTLSNTTLKSTVVNSSLTSVGTLTSLTLGGDLTIPNKIIHSGDTDTFLSFGDDSLSLYAGNASTSVVDFIYGNIYLKGNNKALIGYTTGASSKELIKIDSSDVVQIGEGLDATFTGTITVGASNGSEEVKANRTRVRHIDGLADASDYSHGDLFINHISSGNIICSSNVGVGTTSPDTNSNLHIEGSGYKTLLIDTSASGGGGLIVEQGGTQAAVYGTGGSTWLTGSATTDALIRAEANLILATGGNNRAVTIDSSQNVGIGTSSPYNLSNYKFLSVSASTGGGLICMDDGTVKGGVYNAVNDMYYDTTTNHIFRTGASGALGGTERMRITSVGDVMLGNQTMTDHTYQTLGIRGDSSSGVTSVTLLSSGANSSQRSWAITSNYSAHGNLDFKYSSDRDGTPFTNTAMVINSSGNVGIGTTSPSENLHIKSDASAATTLKIEATASNQRADIVLYGNYTGSNNDFSEILFVNNNDSVAAISAGRDTNDGNGSIKFTTQAATLSQGMTIRAILSSEGDFFTNDGTVSSLSDKRTKKDIADLEDGLSIINQLKPKTFKYNGKTALGSEDNKTRYGFIADDVLEVASQYVEIGTEKIDGVEVDDFKSLSMMRMFPMLVKAVQELSAKVEALEMRKKLNQWADASKALHAIVLLGFGIAFMFSILTCQDVHIGKTKEELAREMFELDSLMKRVIWTADSLGSTMIEFLLGLAIGLAVASTDMGEPVPYQTITYTDSSRVVKVYNTSAFKYRYMPNTYAIGWNTNDYKYWDTRPIKPLYVKTIHANPKPKPKPKERDDKKPIGEQSSLNISLPMLLQAIGFISAMVYGYGQLNTRISFLEHKSQGNESAIEEMKAMQDLPIPSDVRQDEKIRRIEEEILRIRDGKK